MSSVNLYKCNDHLGGVGVKFSVGLALAGRRDREQLGRFRDSSLVLIVWCALRRVLTCVDFRICNCCGDRKYASSLRIPRSSLANFLCLSGIST